MLHNKITSTVTFYAQISRYLKQKVTFGILFYLIAPFNESFGHQANVSKKLLRSLKS